MFVTNAFDKVAISGPALSSVGLGFPSVIDNEPRIVGVELRYHVGAEEKLASGARDRQVLIGKGGQPSLKWMFCFLTGKDSGWRTL